MAKNNKTIIQRRRLISGTRYSQMGIFGRLFGRGGLEIEIKHQPFSFSNLDDFKTFLEGKTEIPASKMQEMLKRSELHLREEIKQLNQVEQTINEKLAATIRDPKTIDTYLDGATMVRFSQDYDWRQIMFELSKQSTKYSEYKLEAVTYYIKYLRSRINVARDILQKTHKVAPPSDDQTRMNSTLETRAITAEELQAAREKGEIENDVPEIFGKSSFAETRVDLEEEVEEKDKKVLSEFKRIPRGQTIIVDTSTMPMIPIKIATRQFIIDMTNSPQLISKTGDNYPLKQGENLIGRSTKCSIILNPEFVDVSRQHLIIELYPNNDLHFTDLSTSGSQIPSTLFKDEEPES